MYNLVTGDWSVLWKGDNTENQEDKDKEPHLCGLLTSVLWRLAACRTSTAQPPGILSYGLRHPDHTMHALADTIHAFQLHGEPECVSIHLIQSLLTLKKYFTSCN